MTETERDVLAHLHANPATGTADLAAALGLAEPDVRAAVDALVDGGHVERRGDELHPDAGTASTPGIFVATERQDASPVEVDAPDDER